MQKSLIAAAFATSLVFPCTLHAQPAATPQLRVTQADGSSVSPWIWVGAGAALAVVLVNTIIPEEVGYLALGAIGGYLGTVWYNGGQIEFRASATSR